MAIVEDDHQDQHKGEDVRELSPEKRDDIVASHDLGEVAGSDSENLEQVETEGSGDPADISDEDT